MFAWKGMLTDHGARDSPLCFSVGSSKQACMEYAQSVKKEATTDTCSNLNGSPGVTCCTSLLVQHARNDKITEMETKLVVARDWAGVAGALTLNG